MTDQHLDSVRGLLADHVLAVLDKHHAAVVDGGTHSGVMRVMGESIAAAGCPVPLIGVAATGTVRIPGRPSPDENAELDPDHTAVLLVPGDEWGAESQWIAQVADILAGAAPSATLVINGGEITYADIERSIDARRPVVVVAGSGRTADAVASAARGEDDDTRAARLVRSGVVHAVDIDDGPAVAGLLDELLTPP
jgi:hypothetical protein